MLPIRIKACSESDLRMLGNLARNIQRVLPVTQADIDAAAALGKGWVVWKVIEVNDPIDNLRGGTQLVIKQNSITPGQNVRRVLIVQGPGGETVVIGPGPSPLLLPDAIANSLAYVKAFGGTEQRNLPDGYTQLDGIVLDGSSYVDTGLTSFSNDGVYECDFVTPATLGTRFVFGQNPNAESPQVGFFTTASNLNWQYGAGSRLAPNASANTTYSIVAENGKLTTNGTASTNAASESVTINQRLFVGTGVVPSANPNQNTPDARMFVGTIKRFKYTLAGVVICDLVPVKRNSDNVLGFYDTARNTFLTNAGTGTFVAGSEAVPTPDAPMDIVSNNGVLRVLRSATGSTTQAGTPTPTNPIPLVSYQQNDLILRGVGAYADTYDSSTQTVTRRVDVKIFDGTEAWAMLSNNRGFAYGVAANDPCRVGVPLQDEAMLCTHFNFVEWSDNSQPMPLNSIGYNISSTTQTTNGNITIRPDTSVYNTVDKWKTWLAEQYANGTPVIAVRIATESTETVPSIYIEGTVETINAHSKNLLDMATGNIVLGKYINNSGVVTDSSLNFYNSKYIPVVAGETYTWSTSSSISFFSVMEYDSGYVFKKRTLFGTSTSSPAGTSGTITLESDTAFVLIGSNMDSTNVTLDKITAIDWQFEKGSTATEYAQYYNGGTATAEMLLKVGDYQDVQSILDGVVTRNVGVKVLDGTEDWSRTDARAKLVLTNSAIGSANWQPYCTHYQGFLGSVTIGNMPDNSCKINVNTNELLIKDATHNTDLATWKQYLADQYAAGTPVIVLYPLATPTTESVAGQALQVTGGDNVLEITQASLSGLELEAEYTKVA